MFTSLVTALAAVASVSGIAIPRATPPKGWATAVLEPYDTYNTRYMALGCQNKHSTPFFDLCCHPMKAGETLATARDASCNPTNVSHTSSAAASKPTQNNTSSDDSDDDSGDCDDGDDNSSQPPAPTKTPAAKPTSTPKATSTQKPTTTAKPTTTKQATTAKPAATNAASSSGSSLNTGGLATFFYQNGVAGACGTVHKDSDFIAAIDVERYGDTGRQSSLCGKQVHITNPANGKSVTVTIQDACPTCANGNSIDLSVGAFKQIATEEQGEVKIVWSFA